MVKMHRNNRIGENFPLKTLIFHQFSVYNVGMEIWRFIKNRWRLSLFVAFICIVCVIFFNLMWGDPNLATAMVAFATLLLAFVAAMSIDTIRAQDKLRRKEALLNDIIEWATDVIECEVESPFSALQTGVKDERVLMALLNLSLLSKYRVVGARSEYAEGIALTFGKSLQSAVKKITDELAATVEFLQKHLDSATAEEIRKHRESLVLSALAVIREATQIKTKDTGWG